MQTTDISTNTSDRVYEIWEPEPAPNNGPDWNKVVARGVPFDKDWEEWSYPIGNGSIGACLFGRVDTERIQITEKTLHNAGCYQNGGATNFAEIYLDFNHGTVQNFRRSLNLNQAIAYVSYQKDGVTYKREYFTSYPDNVLAVKLTADKQGALSFLVRPEIPYLDKQQRTGTITAQGDLLTLTGTMPFFSCNYEGQIKVVPQGGSVKANNEDGTMEVRNADEVILLLATGTNYRLSERIFLSPAEEKLDRDLFPHEEISARIDAALALGYDALKKRHLDDYQTLFHRVAIHLNSEPASEPTHALIEKYKQDQQNTWLEELMFQYARYLLIASSRETTLPANLQGNWSQYYFTPWSGGYWHNINVQMNYWGAMSTDLAECFEAYIAYFKAYLPRAEQYADAYVKEHKPDRVSPEEGENGWILGTGANAYHIGETGGHSGPGTGGFTSKLLMDYYLFTRDGDFLADVAYPAMRSLSTFYSKALVPHGEWLLVAPSASPEQKPEKKQIDEMSGHMSKGGYYVTTGCTFDQGFVWENFNDTLILAKALNKNEAQVKTIKNEITKLDPILIGSSGQIKEYREEEAYSDIGDPEHRHISHLCPLYPGTLINAGNREWMRAASKTLDLRGDLSTGWAMAHRMNCRARLKEGDKAHRVYQQFIANRIAPNLWALHPPFQIDGNMGTMAGVVEMLLQSHEGFVELLPALPKAWLNGMFRGLVARGNFVVSAVWKNGSVSEFSVLSRSGGTCRLKVAAGVNWIITDPAGNVVDYREAVSDIVSFPTEKGLRYVFLPG
jgi:alpha-L-fucosidase 2